MKTNKDNWKINKSKVVFDLYITFSKIMALLILASSSWYAIANKDNSILILGMTISAGLIGWRQQKQKEINQNGKS